MRIDIITVLPELLKIFCIKNLSKLFFIGGANETVNRFWRAIQLISKLILLFVSRVNHLFFNE